MNQPPEPLPTAFQLVSAPDSKSSMTIIFGCGSHAARKRLSAADRISAPATAALLRSRIPRMSRLAPVEDPSVGAPRQPRDGAEVLDRSVGISLVPLAS